MDRETAEVAPVWRCTPRCRVYRERCGDKDKMCRHTLEGAVAGDLDEPVFVVESELEETMFEEADLLAVCAPTLRWQDAPRWREGFRGWDVILCPVATAESRSHMQALARALLPLARELRWLELPDLLPRVKQDADIDLGLDAHVVQALALSARPWREEELDAATLLAQADAPWLIDRLLPAGLTLLTGPPGPRLSSLALELALAVAQGVSPVAMPGAVLYCVLDEPLNALTARLRLALAGDPPPTALFLRAGLPTLDEGGIAVLQDWARRYPEGRLIVIDGLDQVQPRRTDLGLNALTLLEGLAAKLDGAILAVQGVTRVGHRHRPAGRYHRLQLRTEGAQRGVLEGVDGGSGRLALSWDSGRERWIAQEPQAASLSGSRQAVWDLLAARGSLTPAEISALLGQPGGTTRSLLLRMTRDGQLTTEQGRYRRAGDVAGLLPAPEG